MDLCEFQGEPGKRILHGQVDAKEHASGDKIATYIGPTAIYVTDMDKSVDFWTRLGGTVMDRRRDGRLHGDHADARRHLRAWSYS